jgi:hypothetical protein
MKPACPQGAACNHMANPSHCEKVHHDFGNKSRICRFFNMEGGCKAGEKCQFEHVKDVKGLAPKKSNGWIPIRVHNSCTQGCLSFFLEGCCSNGDSCNFAHNVKDIIGANRKLGRSDAQIGEIIEKFTREVTMTFVAAEQFMSELIQMDLNADEEFETEMEKFIEENENLGYIQDRDISFAADDLSAL